MMHCLAAIVPRAMVYLSMSIVDLVMSIANIMLLESAVMTRAHMVTVGLRPYLFTPVEKSVRLVTHARPLLHAKPTWVYAKLGR